MKYTGPKVRISRALGVAFTPKAAKVMERKPYPPGQHGPNQQFRRKRPSPYKTQLVEKQKIRAQYNISEKKLRNYYKKAFKQVGNTGDNLVGLLESRLDNVILRGGFARTIYQARQMVNHGHFLVDGKRVNIPSYSVVPGQAIQVRPKSQKCEMFADGRASAGHIPKYISVDEGTLSVSLTHIPNFEEVTIFAEIPKVVEFYAR